MVIKRKLRWFRHVLRSSGINIAKTVLQGVVNGKRRRGRRERGGKTISRKRQGWTLPAEVRTRLIGLLLTHIWCPNDHTMLWDRLEQMKFTPIYTTTVILQKVQGTCAWCACFFKVVVGGGGGGGGGGGADRPAIFIQ